MNQLGSVADHDVERVCSPAVERDGLSGRRASRPSTALAPELEARQQRVAGRLQVSDACPCAGTKRVALHERPLHQHFTRTA
jgi:hypothetical protein